MPDVTNLVECFWCMETTGIRRIAGTPFCQAHAVCGACGRTVGDRPFTCACEHYGFTQHEEQLFCSSGCLDAAHPNPIIESTPEELSDES